MRFICDSVTAGGIVGTSSVGTPDADADGTALVLNNSEPVAQPVNTREAATKADTIDADLPAARRPLLLGTETGFTGLLALILGLFGGFGSFGGLRRGPRARLK